MGLDIGKVSIEYLPRPSSKAANEFAQWLAEEADCTGDENSFGFFLKDKVLGMVEEYGQDEELSQKDIKKITRWVESLPWDEDGCLTLYFSW
ncbi:MAG: hypothetical protein C4542_05210 [Dehalococcoidia bacterium]|nr:MAG: hypothetical protein C4542_05210 [Dehalococcoidia bacterium]